MIDLGFSPQMLYSALRLSVTFALPDGTERVGQATGFVVRRTDGELFLVTNRHAVDPYDAAPKHPGARFERVLARGRNYHVDVTKETEIHFDIRQPPLFAADDAMDLALFPMSSARLLSGSQVVEHYIPDTLLASEAEFGEEIRVGDLVASPGFIELPGVTLDRPVFLAGFIASDTRVPLTIKRPQAHSAKAILCQSLSRPGLSGSPLFAVQRGIDLVGLSGPTHRPARLVGVNVGGFHDGQGLPQQHSYFVRSTDLLELLRQS